MDGAEPREFLPDWTLCPGVILREELAARAVEPGALAASVGLAAEAVAGVIGGTRKIDQAIAERLFAGLGISAQFWLNLQAQYERDLARGVKDMSSEHEEDTDMSELDATARAAGTEVEATVILTHGADALLRLPGEEEPVRWPAAEVAAGAGVPVKDLAGLRLLVTVRESRDEGRVLSGFRRAEG